MAENPARPVTPSLIAENIGIVTISKPVTSQYLRVTRVIWRASVALATDRRATSLLSDLRGDSLRLDSRG